MALSLGSLGLATSVLAFGSAVAATCNCARHCQSKDSDVFQILVSKIRPVEFQEGTHPEQIASKVSNKFESL